MQQAGIQQVAQDAIDHRGQGFAAQYLARLVAAAAEGHRTFLLADEPGLGKTAQALLAAEAAAAYPLLVVVPNVVKMNWAREVERWTPQRRATVIHGDGDASAPLELTGRRTAELTKYAANAFLATKITFINEIADLCEAVGADVQDVSRGIGLDNRIGGKFLHAGPGYGGSCFPKDTRALFKTALDHDVQLKIVEATLTANDNRKRAMGRKVIAAMGGDVRGKCVAILGLTFKPNTDDMRDSPAIAVIQALQDAGATVRAYDPEGHEQAKKVLENVQYCDGAYQTMEGADALVILTEWNAFRALDLRRVKSLLSAPVLVDLRNIYNREQVEAAGFAYTAVGR